MMIGLPATVNPGDSKPSTFPKLPSWKMKTRAPNDAVIESSVMITALIGITTEPNSRNRISALAPRVQAIAYGIVADWLAMKSSPCAASPPTSADTPATSTSRTSGTTSMPSGLSGASGLIAANRRAADVGVLELLEARGELRRS